MKTLAPSLITEKAKSQVQVYYLLDLGGFYFTDKREGYTYTNSYIYYPFTFGNIKGSDADPLEGTTLEMGNVNNTMSAAILNNTLREATVRIREIYLDSAGTFVGIETLFYGKVSGRPSCNEQSATITLVPHRNPWSVACPRRRISKHCGWKFKDADCGYVGAQTLCDKTFARCTTLGRTATFGGFRFLPEKGTQFIYGTNIIRIK